MNINESVGKIIDITFRYDKLNTICVVTFVSEKGVEVKCQKI